MAFLSVAALQELRSSEQTIYATTLDISGLPSEVRLFAKGENETTKGTFLFDAKAAKSVLARAKEWGNEFYFDYDHKSLKHDAPPEAGRAAGWFGLELRDGELWAVHIKWTEAMAGFLQKKEFRYLSPAFKVDDDKRIVEFVNCAVTNLPATHDSIPLVAAKAVPFHPYPLDASVWDADAATGRIRKWASSDGSGEPATINWSKYGLAFAWIDSRYSNHTVQAFKLPHHDVVDGRLVTSRAGVIAAVAALGGARGGMDIPTTDLTGVKKHLEGHYQQMGLRPPWQKENKMDLEQFLELLKSDPKAAAALSKLLNAEDAKKIEALSKEVAELKGKAKGKDDKDPDDDGDEDEVEADDDGDDAETKAKKMKAAKAKKAKKAECTASVADIVAKLTGKTDVDEQIAALITNSQATEENKKLAARLDARDKKDAEEKLATLTAAAVSGGFLSPAQRDAMGDALTVKMLEKLIAGGKKLVTTTQDPTVNPPEPDEQSVTLSKDELKIMGGILGPDFKDAEKLYKATKAKHKANGVIA